jgi:hypothetical protein
MALPQQPPFARSRISFERRDADAGNTSLEEADLGSSGAGEIDDPSLSGRTTIIDTHLDGAAFGESLDLHAAAEERSAMG